MGEPARWRSQVQLRSTTAEPVIGPLGGPGGAVDREALRVDQVVRPPGREHLERFAVAVADHRPVAVLAPGGDAHAVRSEHVREAGRGHAERSQALLCPARVAVLVPVTVAVRVLVAQAADQVLEVGQGPGVGRLEADRLRPVVADAEDVAGGVAGRHVRDRVLHAVHLRRRPRLAGIVGIHVAHVGRHVGGQPLALDRADHAVFGELPQAGARHAAPDVVGEVGHVAGRDAQRDLVPVAPVDRHRLQVDVRELRLDRLFDDRPLLHRVAGRIDAVPTDFKLPRRRRLRFSGGMARHGRRHRHDHRYPNPHNSLLRASPHSVRRSCVTRDTVPYPARCQACVATLRAGPRLRGTSRPAGSVEQPSQPVYQPNRVGSVTIQIPGADCRSHHPRFLSRGQPGMNLGTQYLAAELAVGDGYSVNICLRPWPHRITLRNHAGDEVLDFAGGFVIRHQPDANSWSALDDGPGLIGLAWRGDIHSRQRVDHCIPATLYVVVCIQQDAQRFSPRHSHLVSDCSEKGILASLVIDVESVFQFRAPAKVIHDVLVVGTFHQQHARWWRTGARHSVSEPRYPDRPRPSGLLPSTRLLAALSHPGPDVPTTPPRPHAPRRVRKPRTQSQLWVVAST